MILELSIVSVTRLHACSTGVAWDRNNCTQATDRERELCAMEALGNVGESSREASAERGREVFSELKSACEPNASLLSLPSLL